MRGILGKLFSQPSQLTKEEWIKIFATSKYDTQIIKYADELRKKTVGDKIYIRGIIEFSNFCRRDCLYCGIRRSNRKAERYRMSNEEIIERGKLIAKAQIQTVVLQSGEDLSYSTDDIKEIIQELKKEGLVVTLSLGERKFEEYEIWKEAGADRYLMRHETANEKLYQKLHPDSSLKERIKHLEFLKKLGYEAGAGNMVGLPGQGPEELADDIIFLLKFQPQMIGIGPFLPHPDTPLGDFQKEKNLFQKSLKMVALARIVVPNANIPATTAMGSLKEGGREITLQSGANVIMPNLTPNPYRPNYALYPEKICLSETDTQCIGCVRRMIRTLGREPV